MMIAQKINLWFGKSGAAIYFSHLDLLRHFSRLLRRARLRPRLTSGFNPRPRLVFPHPLSLGVASLCETVEIEFDEKRPLPEILAALKNADGGVLDFYRCEALPPFKAGKIVTQAIYELSGFPENAPLQQIIDEILSRPEIVITRGHHEKQRAINIRPYLANLQINHHTVNVWLNHTDSGAGRIDEIAKLFAEKITGDWSTLAMQKTSVIFR